MLHTPIKPVSHVSRASTVSLSISPSQLLSIPSHNSGAPGLIKLLVWSQSGPLQPGPEPYSSPSGSMHRSLGTQSLIKPSAALSERQEDSSGQESSLTHCIEQKRSSTSLPYEKHSMPSTHTSSSSMHVSP